jgi:hypothetical protein
MRKTICVAATALLFLSSAAFAQSTTPGHEMQNKGSKSGSPGASGYAPVILAEERLAASGLARRPPLDQSQADRGRADQAVADKKSLDSPPSPCLERRAFSFHGNCNGDHDQDYWDGEGGEKQARKRSSKLEFAFTGRWSR